MRELSTSESAFLGWFIGSLMIILQIFIIKEIL
jgi:hypothetical protein